MAQRIRVQLNRAGVRELLRSSEVRADLERRASAIARAAGDGMETDSEVGPNRARASVRTATSEAVKAEAEHRSLTSAIDAGRQ